MIQQIRTFHAMSQTMLAPAIQDAQEQANAFLATLQAGDVVSIGAQSVYETPVDDDALEEYYNHIITVAFLSATYGEDTMRYSIVQTRTDAKPFDICDTDGSVTIPRCDHLEAERIAALLNAANDTGLTMRSTDQVAIEHDFADLATDSENHFVRYMAGEVSATIATPDEDDPPCVAICLFRDHRDDDDSERFLEAHPDDARHLFAILSHPDMQRWMGLVSA